MGFGFGEALRWSKVTNNLPPKLLPAAQYAFLLMRHARAFGARIDRDRARLLKMDGLIPVAGPVPGASGFDPNEREKLVAFLNGDAEHLLGLANRIGDAFAILSELHPGEPKLAEFAKRIRPWFKLPNDLRNDVEHGADLFKSKRGRTVVLGYDATRVYYSSTGATGPTREIEVCPALLNSLETVWGDFLDVLGQI
jgi:hypothetical protein